MKHTTSLILVALATVAVACGPSQRGQGDDVGDDAPDAALNCIPTAAVESSCNDGFDNDCNHYVDCEDSACAGTPECPVQTCEVTTPSVSFPLPDGNCNLSLPHDPGVTDAQMQAFLDTCGAYEGVMDLTGFPAGARLDDPSKLLGICVKTEHSWLRDLQMEAHCPDGQRVLLSKFRGQDCPSGACEVYLGQANDLDDDSTPVPGTGWDYCWTTAATNGQMLDVANAAPDPFPNIYQLPAGDYQPSEPFNGFAGCTLNGAWKIRVVDGWGIDNGFVFETKMMFDPSISDDCPVIE